MNNRRSMFETGEIVEIIMGRDKGNFAVVVDIIDDRFLLIADGDKRKHDNPKRKNVHHIRSKAYISKEIVNTVMENKKLSNAKLRYVLQDFISNHLNKDEKGE